MKTILELELSEAVLVTDGLVLKRDAIEREISRTRKDQRLSKEVQAKRLARLARELGFVRSLIVKSLGGV
jgi:hypothetical protein